MTLGPILGEGMVLQRGSKAPIFGTANPGDKISVTFRDKTAQGVADEKGSWRIDVNPGEAGGPFSMAIQGKTKIDLKEVYVGEVWVCSGQSNMRYALSYSKDAAKLVLEPPNPKLRLQRCLDASYAPNHPPEKKAIGERVALAARAVVYGEKAEYVGPLIESAKIENNRIVLTFSHADGLTAHDGELRQFEIQSKGEEKFTQAKAQIVGAKVILDASGTTAPLTVRYGYREWPDGNLYNSADLPASPFSITDIK
jgi:hypothetical protein